MNTQRFTARTLRAFGVLAALAQLTASGCKDDGGEAEGESGEVCEGAKCDIPDEGSTEPDPAGSDFPDWLFEVCSERKAEAFTNGREAFSREALRWSCADVPGTDPGLRGQEYCEYFAIVQRPGADEADVLGLIEVVNPSTETEPQEIAVTPSGIELTEDEVYALEQDPTAEAGRCVFSSWNADQTCDDCDDSLMVMGLPVSDPAVFQMKFDANTFEAAVQLVDDCLEYLPEEGDPDNLADPYHDDFLRACDLNAAINETEYRKSDNTVCASALRFAECGCDAGGADVAEGLSHPGQLGFQLGGWEGPDVLPSGCRYERVSADAKQVVTCGLTAAEVLDNATELKHYCATKYADDVVVHVSVPADALSCSPDVSADPYAATCGEEPWNVQP